MIVNFGVYALGYNLGGRDYPFEIEIEDKELEGLTEDEKYEYIHKYCFEYLMDSLEIGIEDIELEID